jgi:hypothetical protein
MMGPFGSRRLAGVHGLRAARTPSRTSAKGIIILLVSALAMTGSFGLPSGGLHFSPMSEGELPTAPSVAENQVAAAEASLAGGAGPAEGHAVLCSMPGDDVSASCSRPVSSAGGSTQASERATSAPPPPNWGAAMTFDAYDGYVLLFGGANGTTTWTYASGVWTQLSPAIEPSHRTDVGFAYDPSLRAVILFGGEGSSHGPGYLNTTLFNDTWEYSAGTWTNITNPSAPAPSTRWGMGMAYDPLDQYIVLFGGNHYRTFYNDTWVLRGTNWTEIYPSVNPPCRTDTSMTFDSEEGYVLMFGGVGKVSADCEGTTLNRTLDDTWAFLHGEWLSIDPSSSPPGLWGASLTYDNLTKQAILFGGVNGTTDTASEQTWEYVNDDWTLVNLPVDPPARFSAPFAFDPRDGYDLLFGGLNEPEHSAIILGDVWRLGSGVWTNLTPLPLPAARSGAALAYDVKDEYVLLFGGQNATGYLGDTWKFSAGVWVPLIPPLAPSARAGASMAYDAKDGYLVLFGGDGPSGPLSDTWTYVRGTWTNVTSESNATPPGRFGASLTYDDTAGDQYLVLFGGEGASGDLGDTWSFVGGQWTNETTPAGAAPSPREGAGMTYYEATGTGYVLLFGGSDGTTEFDDTWEFAQGAWTELTLGSTPGARTFANLADDTVDGYALLFGGWNASAFNLSDTWLYNASGWHELFPILSPPGLYRAAVAFDGEDGYALLFGGELGSIPRAGTWQYEGGQWRSWPVPILPAPTSALVFTESGLATGTPWSVTLNGTVASSSTAGIVFTEPNGSYRYTVASVSGYLSSPPSGRVTVYGVDLVQEISFSASYAVNFEEVGLSSGTPWTVTMNGTPGTSTALGIPFSEPNGTYGFTVGSVAGYESTVSAGSIVVRGLPISVTITFHSNGTAATLLGLPAAEGYALLAGILAAAVVVMASIVWARRHKSTPPNVSESSGQPDGGHPPGPP